MPVTLKNQDCGGQVRQQSWSSQTRGVEKGLERKCARQGLEDWSEQVWGGPGYTGPVHIGSVCAKAGNPSSGFQHHRPFSLSLLMVFIVVVCSSFKFVSSN